MLYLFLFAHLVADFVLQPFWLVQRKKGWDGLLIHGGIVLACMLLLPLAERATLALLPAMLAITAKAAMISTVLGVGAELGSGSDDALTRALRTGTQDTINQSGQQIVRRQLNVTPTLTIRPGFPVRVIVTKDLILAPIGDRR